MGEDLSPIPMKLAQCIWEWKFIDMTELPESYGLTGVMTTTPGALQPNQNPPLLT